MTYYIEKMANFFDSKAGQPTTTEEYQEHIFQAEQLYFSTQIPMMRASIDMAMPLNQRVLKLMWLTRGVDQ